TSFKVNAWFSAAAKPLGSFDLGRQPSTSRMAESTTRPSGAAPPAAGAEGTMAPPPVLMSAVSRGYALRSVNDSVTDPAVPPPRGRVDDNCCRVVWPVFVEFTISGPLTSGAARVAYATGAARFARGMGWTAMKYVPGTRFGKSA